MEKKRKSVSQWSSEQGSQSCLKLSMAAILAKNYKTEGEYTRHNRRGGHATCEEHYEQSR